MGLFVIDTGMMQAFIDKLQLSKPVPSWAGVQHWTNGSRQ
ncbi:5f40dde6-ebed-49c4-a9ff-01cef216ec40 [Thermothielavioides terrestris]|uniref:5f40dde6-ebed-49c4-a9ff-01cef216ec40 n=1 Tax=Thermothielavioides terrestris TaxID=2587410 RepID=A0A446BKQ6_9PEZI|nr:5f40dde6-ebed-49c4-a9ff-01cef216ec40 [Thermothielavioides terrestris]